MQAQLQLPLLIAADIVRVSALSGKTGQPIVSLTRAELIDIARESLNENAFGEHVCEFFQGARRYC